MFTKDADCQPFAESKLISVEWGRDGPLFPEQEIGRGVLRRWANLTVAT